MKTRGLVCLIFVLLFAVNAHAANLPVIIKIAPTANISLIANTLGGTVLDSIPGANTYLLSLPNLPLVSTTLQLLGVQWIDLNKFMTLPSMVPVAALSVPANAAPDWYKYQPSMQLIRSNAAQPYSGVQSVVVADINSKVDFGHPALIGHLTSGYDFVAGSPAAATQLNQSSAGFLDDQSSAGFLDDQSSAGFLDDQSSAGFLDNNGVGVLSGFLDGTNPAASHGTLCVGVIAAVAPKAMIMPLRAFDDNGNADTFTLAKAIRYAANNGAHILSMSFGTLKDVKVLREAVQFAQNKNVLLVASAGNNSTSAAQYPAAYSGVLGSAATDLFDVKGWFSNYGTSNVVLDAPGVNIIAPYPGNRYSIVSGTSFSTPAVAGEAALIRSLKSTGVASYLTGNVVKIDNRNPNYVGKLGYGRIDVLNAVKAAGK
jgi:subtilisin family serine protease